MRSRASDLPAGLKIAGLVLLGLALSLVILEVGLRMAAGFVDHRAVSAADGSKRAEYKLEKLPAWDGIAAAYGRLFIVNQDGSIECWGTG